VRNASATSDAETSAATGARPASLSYASLDLFDLGRRAAEARNGRVGGARASFVRSRQLLSTGAWRGPRDAAESYVEAADLHANLPADQQGDAGRARGRRHLAGRRR